VLNWISLKTRLKKEIGLSESWELPECWEFNERTYRKVCFFKLSCLIFTSSRLHHARGITEWYFVVRFEA
jgi:hypothetical protein